MWGEAICCCCVNGLYADLRTERSHISTMHMFYLCMLKYGICHPFTGPKGPTHHDERGCCVGWRRKKMRVRPQRAPGLHLKARWLDSPPGWTTYSVVGRFYFKILLKIYPGYTHEFSSSSKLLYVSIFRTWSLEFDKASHEFTDMQKSVIRRHVGSTFESSSYTHLTYHHQPTTVHNYNHTILLQVRSLSRLSRFVGVDYVHNPSSSPKCSLSLVQHDWYS